MWINQNKFYDQPGKWLGEGDNQELLKLIDYNKNVDLPNFNEMETTYKYPPLTGVLAKILWINGKASGFYIVRLKGSQDDSCIPYELPVLDGVFIKSNLRRQGWGTKMLLDLTNEFPNQDVGFSFPISVSLKKVLNKFLSINKPYRPLFWVVKNVGEEGDRLNVWFCQHQST